MEERTEALRESEEHYRVLFEDSRDAIFLTSQGIIVDANQAALDLFGFTREEVIGSDAGERYVDLANREQFQREMAEKGSVRNFEVKLKKKDGTELDCLLTAGRRRVEDGRDPDGIQGIVHDITERKRAEEALSQQAQDLAILEERNRMAREIHDTLAQGFTGIVLQLEAGEQVLKESPDEVLAHLSRAKGLARESLQEARRSVWDLLPQVLEHHTLESALEEEVRRFGAAGQEQASFTYSGNGQGLTASVQSTLLRICQESLANVRRHANATAVKVNLASYPDSIGLTVQDDGVGSDSQELNAPGTPRGFGLTGMEQRAHLLGGTFSVNSQKGKGTAVEVRLPIP